MPLPDQLEPLKTFRQADEPPTLAVAIASRMHGDLSLQRLNLTQEVANSLRDIPRRVTRRRNIVLREFDLGHKPDDNEIVVLPINSSPAVESTVDLLKEIPSLPLYDAADQFVENIEFYVLALENEDGESSPFFRGAGATLELRRRHPHALILGADTFSQVDKGVVLVDDNVDCFTWSGDIYINNIRQFSKIFQYLEALRVSAAATLDALLAAIPVKNGDELRAACSGDLNMVAKLGSISRKPYLQNLTLDMVKETINRYGLPVQIEDEDGAEALIFETSPNKRWVILKILDDDYLSSEMTDQNYEANSKTSLGG